jgi:hypothetical protein
METPPMNSLCALFFLSTPLFLRLPARRTGITDSKKKIAQVWYKKKKEGKTTLSKSERKTVLQLASLIPG